MTKSTPPALLIQIGQGVIMQHLFKIFWLVALLVVLASCRLMENSLASGGIDPAEKPSYGASLSLFLHLRDPAGPPLDLTVSKVEILAGGEWFTLSDESFELDATAIGDEQIFLLRQTLPPANYTAIRFMLEDAAIKRDEQMVFLSLSLPILELPLADPLRLTKGDSTCLFLTWNLKESLQGMAVMRPSIHIDYQKPLLLADIAYVACPDIDTVYTIRTDRHRVSGSFGVTGRPSFLAADQERNRLYVLTEKESAIKVFELSSNRQLDIFRFPITRKPSYLVLSPDKRWAYVLDGRGSYIVRMDLFSGSVTGRVRLGERSQFLYYLPDQDRLAVSFGYSQEVVLLDPKSLDVLERISVGALPQGMLFQDDLLYVAESGGNTVLMYDLTTKRVDNRFHVGRQPRRIFGGDNRVYVANHGSSSVSILFPRHLGSGKEIYIGGSPLEMTETRNKRKLYIGNEEGQEIVVLDLTADRVTNRIDLRSEPLGLLSLQ